MEVEVEVEVDVDVDVEVEVEVEVEDVIVSSTMLGTTNMLLIDTELLGPLG